MRCKSIKSLKIIFFTPKQVYFIKTLKVRQETASDMTLLDTTLLPHGRSYFDGVQMASLDHAMWFHRPFRADEWMLYEQRAISSSSARGLAAGSIYTKDGELAVNVSQEGLIRPTS